MALFTAVLDDTAAAKNQLDTIRQIKQNIIQHRPPTSEAGKTTTEQTMKKLEQILKLVQDENSYIYNRGRFPHVWIGYRDDIAHLDNMELRQLEDRVKEYYERKMNRLDFEVNVDVEAIIDHNFYREQEDPDYMGDSRVEITISIK